MPPRMWPTELTLVSGQHIRGMLFLPGEPDGKQWPKEAVRFVADVRDREPLEAIGDRGPLPRIRGEVLTSGGRVGFLGRVTYWSAAEPLLFLQLETLQEAVPVQRRGFFRVPFRLPVEVQLPDGQVISAKTQDLSGSGICLHFRQLSASLVPGSTVQLAFWLEGFEIRTPARVVWRRDKEGAVTAGLQFEGLRSTLQDRIIHFLFRISRSSERRLRSN
ncbi:MAG: PilZ domain-containing protein [Firmicutes bacterium]|nr:PilZ domain-containing protein [Bacillota bacterium]